MIDLLMAIFGKKYCGWCNYKPDNFIERWAGQYKIDESTPKRIVWWLYTHAGLGLWRLGRRWHFKFHNEIEFPGDHQIT